MSFTFPIQEVLQATINWLSSVFPLMAILCGIAIMGYVASVIIGLVKGNKDTG